jgi:Skp family chaperone for outer membrane proteins
MQAMAPAARKALMEETAKQRETLKQQIDELARQRSDYLKKEVDKTGGVKDSLDQKIYGAVREQAEKKGLRYGAESPAY